MQIVYSYKDLVRLIKADLTVKRIELLTAPEDTGTSFKSSVTCEVEFIEQASAAPPELETTLEKARAFLEERKEEKAEVVPAVVAKSKYATGQKEPSEKELARRKLVAENNTRRAEERARVRAEQSNAQALIAQANAKQAYQRISLEERQAVVEQRTRDYANERGHTVWEPDFEEKVLVEIEELKKAGVVAASPGPFQS
jgi:hypothetical protein